jgi:hypothetical protein
MMRSGADRAKTCRFNHIKSEIRLRLFGCCEPCEPHLSRNYRERCGSLALTASYGIRVRRKLITQLIAISTPWPSGSDEKKIDTVIARSLRRRSNPLRGKNPAFRGTSQSLAMTNPRVPLNGDGAKGMIYYTILRKTDSEEHFSSIHPAHPINGIARVSE